MIILIIVCAAVLADCKLRGKFSIIQKKTHEVNSDADAEHQVLENMKTSDRVVTGVKAHDSDAIFFPSDDDTRLYLDVNKIISETLSAIDNNKHSDVVKITTDTPLLPKVVPAVEAKEVFTNPIPTVEVTNKTMDSKYTILTNQIPNEDPKETKVSEEANVTQENVTTNDNITTVENMKNDIARSNETKLDLTSRFGDTSSYMLVPANNVQTYQPIQTNPNLQGNFPQYGLNNDKGKIMNPVVTNVGENSQYIPQNTNANYNGNLPQGTNLVPITVANTYMINGQLYAALTVPNNMNVPSSIYLINPQLPQSGYQVANNLPVYKVVQGDGYNVNNV
ncbi:uncharacterized protein LOC133528788 isoform X2 [Cydia pomonella]|uniref:uncharacterized protein LOC133528788 isoform X2 n=1 Tax=Cydia pomonella TaxID=82600 RepID=UPI002ADDF894|nr:uncharacterized protein LOC133528788 isoform X2 [Cydia pomonella]